MAKNRIVKDNKSGKFLVLNTETNSPVKLSATERIVKDNATGKYFVINTETKEKISLDSLSSLKKKDVMESSGRTPSTDGKSDTSKLQAQVEFFGKDSAVFKKQEPITDKPTVPKLKTEGLTVDKQKAEKFIAKKEAEDKAAIEEYSKRKEVEKAYDLATSKEDSWAITKALKSGEYGVYQGFSALTGGLLQYVNAITGDQIPELKNASDTMYNISEALSEKSSSFLRVAERQIGVKEDNIDKGLVDTFVDSPEDGFKKLGVQVLATFPQMAAIASTGGTGAGVFASSATLALGQNLSEEWIKDKNITSADALVAGAKSIITGTAETIFSANIIALRGLAGAKTADLIENEITQSVKGIINKEGKEEAKKIVARNLGQATNQALKQGGVEEGAEEVFEGVGTFIVDTIAEGKFDQEKYEEMLKSLPDRFLVGAASGFAVTFPGKLASIKKLTNEQKNKIETYRKVLDTPDVSDETKKLVQSKIDDIKRLNKEESVDEYLRISELPKEEKVKAFDLLTKIDVLENDKVNVKDVETQAEIDNEIDKTYKTIDDMVKNNLEPTRVQALETPTEEKIPQSEQLAEKPVSEDMVSQEGIAKIEEPVSEKKPKQKAKKEQTLEEKEVKDPFGTVEKGIETKDGIVNQINNSIKEGSDKKSAVEKGIQALQVSPAYEKASDVARESMVRLIRKEFGIRQKAAPSVAKLLGQNKSTDKILVDVVEALKDQIRLESRAAKEGIGALQATIDEVVDYINENSKLGKLTNYQNKTLRNILKKNLLNPKIKTKELARAAKIIEDGKYRQKLTTAKELRDQVGKITKLKDIQESVRNAATNFYQVDVLSQDDIDTYIKYAGSIINSQSKVRASKGQVKTTRAPFSIEEINTFANEKNRLKEAARETELVDQYDSAIQQGFIPKEMSFDNFQKLLNDIKSKRSEDIKQENDSTVRDYNINYKFPLVKEFFADKISSEEDVDRKNIMNTLMSRLDDNFDSLTSKEQLEAIDILENYIENDIYDKAGAIESILKGKEESKVMRDRGVKIYNPVTGLIGRGWNWYSNTWSIYFSSVSQFLNNTFRSSTLAKEFLNRSGFNDLIKGFTFAKKQANIISNDYFNKFNGSNPNNKKFYDLYNEYERGMFASLSRTIKDGTPEEIQKEFDRQKGHIEASIEELSKMPSKKDKRKSERLKEVYDDKIKDAKNINDVKSKVDKTNQDAVNYMVDQWAKFYNDFKSVAAAYHNIQLDEDSSYTPDFWMKLDQTLSDNLLEEKSSFNIFFDFISTEEVGTFKKNKRITKDNLPKKDGLVTRVRDYDFSNNNIRAIEKALNDIYTAGAIRQYNAFINSKDLLDMFDDREVATLFREKLNFNAKLLTGSESIKEGKDYRKAVNLVSKLGRIGTRLGLGRITNAAKQTAPIFFNTVVNLGNTKDAVELLETSIFDMSNTDVLEWLNNSGYSISLRGAESQTSIEFANELNKQLEQKELGDINNLADILAKAGDTYIKKFLVEPDVFIAKASWLAYYKKNLKEQGIENIDEINWTTHKVNKKAGDYADTMTQEQQNVNISELGGKLFASRSSNAKLWRQTLFTFASFVMNLKDRNATAITILTSKNSNLEEKSIAARTFVAGLVEASLFESMGAGISAIMKSLAYSMLGLDSEEEEELKRAELESNKNFRLKLFASKILLEFFLPIIPALESLTLMGINKLTDILRDGDPETIYREDQKKKKLEEEAYMNKMKAMGTAPLMPSGFKKPTKSELKKYTDYVNSLNEKEFRFYTPENIEFLDIIGGSPSVGIEKILNTAGLTKESLMGYHKKNFKKYPYSEREKELLYYAAAMSLLSSASILPAEFGDLAKEIKRLADKKAELRSKERNKNPKVSYDPNSVKGARASSDNRPVSSWAELIAMPDMADPNGYRALANDPYAKKAFSLIKYTEEPFKQFGKFGAKDFAELDIEKVKNKIINYISSDKSKERAKYFKEYPDRKFLKENVISRLDKIPSGEKLQGRINNIKTVNVEIEKKGGRPGDAYWFDTHSVILKKDVSETTFAHELGHAMFNKYIYWDSGSDYENKLFADIESPHRSLEINPYLNKQEIDKIKSLAKDFKDLGLKKDEQWRVKDEHYNKEVYLWAAEAYGDLTGLRYLLNKAGLTNNFGDDISPAIMEKANTNEQIKNNPIFLRMKVIFGDKNIIKFNNTISSNEKGNVKNDIMGFVDNLSSYISKV